jgi:cellulose synthase/poly-beta-1,6-N-acetylglucosamine synthase-like glycosyltransferase
LLSTFLTAIALLYGALVALPICVLFIECMAAILWRGKESEDAVVAGRIVVLIPAHNEADLLDATLDTVLPQLREGDRAMVVAHNCSDSTTAVAKARGVEVIVAEDDGSGGKPDALKAGLRALDSDPPEVVVVIDADCSADPNSIQLLAQSAAANNAPAMSVYLFATTAGGSGRQSISSLALLLKNHVRPLGLHHLGLPCLLNGSGSAYPFRQLRDVPHGEGSIAEDYQLSIDLLERGYLTRFVPAARVNSRLPTHEKAALGQRRRWEHGHLYLVFRTAPGMILAGLRKGSIARVALGLELLIPPLAFLVLAWMLGAVLSLLAWLIGGGVAWANSAVLVSTASGSLLFLSVIGSFLRFLGLSRTLLALISIPGYILWKIPLYLGFPAKREKRWTKTER